MEAEIADFVDLRTQLNTNQVEAATGQAATLESTEVIELNKKAILPFETEAVRVSVQQADRLSSAMKTISSLQVAIQARDREILVILADSPSFEPSKHPFTESRSHQTATHGVATSNYRQLKEATMDMGTGSDHALRAARGLVDEQRRVIIGLRNVFGIVVLRGPLIPVKLLRLSSAPTLRVRIHVSLI